MAPDAATAPIDAAHASDDAAVVVADDAFAPGLDAGAVDAPSVGGGSITGRVTRSAMPAAGGRGHLYVAVFTTDPVLDRMGARNVANARVEDVDMSAAGVSVHRHGDPSARRALLRHGLPRRQPHRRRERPSERGPRPRRSRRARRFQLGAGACRTRGP